MFQIRGLVPCEVYIDDRGGSIVPIYLEYLMAFWISRDSALSPTESRVMVGFGSGNETSSDQSQKMLCLSIPSHELPSRVLICSRRAPGPFA